VYVEVETSGSGRSGAGEDRGELGLCRQGGRKTSHNGCSGGRINRSNRMFLPMLPLLKIEVVSRSGEESNED
jgi:hypothetical protein